MYSSVEHFLQKQADIICAILEESAREAGGHYAEMTPQALHHNAEHDTVEFITALAQGRIDRETVRISGARPTHTGLIADDLLRLVNRVEPRIAAYIRQELTDQPDFRDDLLRRLRQVNASFRANLTSVQIDRVIQHLTTIQTKH